MPERRSPTLRRRRLASMLRELHEASGLSAEDVAERLGWSSSKASRMSRFEGKRPDPHDVALLLDVYDVTDTAVRQELLTLAREGGRRGWWWHYKSDVGEPYQIYLDFEAEAVTLLNWEPLVIPGLLQTDDYARAAMMAGPAVVCEKVIEKRVEVRVQRQKRLLEHPTKPLRLLALMHEAAVRLPVGGPEVMRAQLSHILQVAQLPNVAVQVIPFAAGAHCGTLGSFAILEFPEPEDPDAVYVEGVTTETFLEELTVVRAYHHSFQKLLGLATPPEGSMQMIADAAAEL